ncbi:hypothetical protein Q7P36_007092 [Cladosporium allicinum]
MSDLQKGDYVAIHGGLCEILKTIADKESDRTWVSYRSIQAGSDFNRFYPASKEVDVPELTRKEYILIDIGDVESGGFLSLLDSDTGATKDTIRLLEGDMREKMKKLFVDEGKEGDKGVDYIREAGEE